MSKDEKCTSHQMPITPNRKVKLKMYTKKSSGRRRLMNIKLREKDVSLAVIPELVVRNSSSLHGEIKNSAVSNDKQYLAI